VKSPTVSSSVDVGKPPSLLSMSSDAYHCFSDSRGIPSWTYPGPTDIHLDVHFFSFLDNLRPPTLWSIRHREYCRIVYFLTRAGARLRSCPIDEFTFSTFKLPSRLSFHVSFDANDRLIYRINHHAQATFSFSFVSPSVKLDQQPQAHLFSPT